MAIELLLDVALAVLFGATTYAITWFYGLLHLTGPDFWISVILRGGLHLGILFAFGKYVWTVHLHITTRKTKRRKKGDAKA